MPKTAILPTFTLESGTVLRDVPVAFETWGTLNEAGDNVIVVCHALTGDADAADWWGPLVGPARVFDTDRYFVVCANVPGSPYGTVSPRTTNPDTGQPYGPAFPVFSIRDTVALHRALLERLGVTYVALAAGGSMGAMQVLEWGFHRDFVGALAPVACGAWHSPWCIGWSEAQRQAIYADPRWQDGAYDPADPPAAGLAAARMMAMVSYRTAPSFEARFGRNRMPQALDAEAPFAVESYLRYQGQKLVDRFDALCYVRLTQLMDTHDVARGRAETVEAALATLTQPTLVVGIDTDVLYPVAEQEFIARHLPNADLGVVESGHGHDAFLIEFDQLEALLRPWMTLHLACPDSAAVGACS